MNASRKVMAGSYRAREPSPGAVLATHRVLNRRNVRAVSSDPAGRIAELLHEAAETHHVVYRITDGDDPDWASWYADWLLDLSELPDLLGTRPVRSHLVHALVELDQRFAEQRPDERWEGWYARRLVERFAPPEGGYPGPTAPP
jgi:hypothetical protein